MRVYVCLCAFRAGVRPSFFPHPATHRTAQQRSAPSTHPRRTVESRLTQIEHRLYCVRVWRCQLALYEKETGRGLFRKRPFLPKERAKSLPRFKHIGRGLLSAGRAASCLDGDCATRDAALMAHQMRGARLHDWVVVDMLTVLPGVGHRLDAKTSFIISRRAW